MNMFHFRQSKGEGMKVSLVSAQVSEKALPVWGGVRKNQERPHPWPVRNVLHSPVLRRSPRIPETGWAGPANLMRAAGSCPQTHCSA